VGPNDLIGRALGDYRITEYVGGGGMAWVYRAQDTRHHRDVAVKVLQPWLAGEPRVCERFRGEAVEAAQFDHGNIVTVITSGNADGIEYIVMSFVEGETLDEILRRQGPVDADFAVETSQLTRAQIMVNSSTVALQLANAQPQNALALLG
jgi:serine/threonine-protein kinase